MVPESGVNERCHCSCGGLLGALWMEDWFEACCQSCSLYLDLFSADAMFLILLVLSRELNLKGIIHFITSNNHPSNPQQPMHSLGTLAPVSHWSNANFGGFDRNLLTKPPRSYLWRKWMRCRWCWSPIWTSMTLPGYHCDTVVVVNWLLPGLVNVYRKRTGKIHHAIHV